MPSFNLSSKDKHALRLTESAEKVKTELSSLTQTNISLPFITSTVNAPKHIDTTLTRDRARASDSAVRLSSTIVFSVIGVSLEFSNAESGKAEMEVPTVYSGKSVVLFIIEIPKLDELLIDLVGNSTSATRAYNCYKKFYDPDSWFPEHGSVHGIAMAGKRLQEMPIPSH
ncbi:stromal 70 kda heat shock-related protein [Quercus suber]|uniref:Stromal 70 kDa heat shock-related protein n=1 Tax=Quercus suber TaxID=58331 RepID=A0AAW0KKZ0_QUESU